MAALLELEDDEVYFCDGACLSSFSGVVDDVTYSISEAEIADHVRAANPTMYVALGELRIPSWSLQTIVAPALKREGSPLLKEPMNISLARPREPPGSLIYPLTPPLIMDSNVAAEKRDGIPMGSQKASLTVLGRWIMGNLSFTLHRHVNPEYFIRCSSPTCRLTTPIIPLNVAFGGITASGPTTETGDLMEWPVMDIYCLDCFENASLQPMDSERAREGQDSSQAQDGSVEGEHVLLAAAKLHPLLPSKVHWKMYFPTAPPLEAGTGSNSRSGLRLRRQKQYEIERIVQHIREDEKVAAGASDTAKKGSLTLVRPRNLPPYRERYKKQGCEWVDRSSHERKELREEKGMGPTNANLSDTPFPDNGYVCYCREPRGDGPLVRCRFDKCMIVLFHLECTGLANMPDEEEDFTCQYCQSDTLALSQVREDVPPFQSRTWADITPSDADNEESESESFGSPEAEDHMDGDNLDYEDSFGDEDSLDEDTEMVGYDSEEQLPVRPGFVAINRPPLWTDTLPERG